jgi:hypothetical protein
MMVDLIVIAQRRFLRGCSMDLIRCARDSVDISMLNRGIAELDCRRRVSVIVFEQLLSRPTPFSQYITATL